MATIPQVNSRFTDVKPVLDAALASGGGKYVAPTPGAAVHFRQRAYSFRKAYREACSPNASPYDQLTLRKPSGCEVVIAPIALPGTFTPADGTPLNTSAAESDDPLLAEALAVRTNLGLDL